MKFNLPQKLGLLLLAIFPLVALAHGISEEDKHACWTAGTCSMLAWVQAIC
jgi:hypothetical protein